MASTALSPDRSAKLSALIRSAATPVWRARAASTIASGLRHHSGWMVNSVSASPSSRACGETPNGSAKRSSQEAKASSANGVTWAGRRGTRTISKSNGSTANSSAGGTAPVRRRLEVDVVEHVDIHTFATARQCRNRGRGHEGDDLAKDPLRRREQLLRHRRLLQAGALTQRQH